MDVQHFAFFTEMEYSASVAASAQATQIHWAWINGKTLAQAAKHFMLKLICSDDVIHNGTSAAYVRLSWTGDELLLSFLTTFRLLGLIEIPCRVQQLHFNHSTSLPKTLFVLPSGTIKHPPPLLPSSFLTPHLMQFKVNNPMVHHESLEASVHPDLTLLTI